MYGGTQADIFGFISGSAFGTFGTAWVHDFNPMEDILLFNSAFQARWNAAPKFQEGAHLRVAISKDESVVIYNTTLSALQDRIEWSDNFDAFYAQWVSTHSAPPEVPVA
jgi:hypothetical protein